MELEDIDLVDRILAAHEIPGPWRRLESTGVANRIYATHDVVLRVATDHPEAVEDARTESVAAPVAREAGIRTPRLIVFDDSRTITERPFSMWERVHGETLGLVMLPVDARAQVWREVGQQLALLHGRVMSCPDPNGYLDTPGRELHTVDCPSHAIKRLLAELAPFVTHGTATGSTSFLHNDLHEMNIMCSAHGGLLALLDWGDAGWGDPTVDFAYVPLPYVSAALEGYGDAKRLGRYPEARIVWDHLHAALEDGDLEIPVDEYRRFLDDRA